MLMQILYPYIKFVLGTLYPAYRTWKSLKRKDDTARRRWMKYWVSFGAFQLFEMVSDITLAFVVPFYIELKLASILWLVLGTKLVFDSIVNRELTKREKLIDKWLNKVTKIRDEFVALAWFEISRCSIKIFTALMSGGFSILAKSPEQSEQASPICSEAEEEADEPPEAAIEEEKKMIEEPEPDKKRIKKERQPRALQRQQDQEEQETTVHYYDHDFNKNRVHKTVSMEWSAITLNDVSSSRNGINLIKTIEPSPRVVTGNKHVATRKSLRQHRDLSTD